MDADIGTFSKAEVARSIIDSHFAGDPGLKRAFEVRADDRSEESSSEPIKLLEVNDYTFAAGIQPLYFGRHPASGVVYPSVIISITPKEFEDLDLPAELQKFGWKLGREFERPAKKAPKRPNGKKR